MKIALIGCTSDTLFLAKSLAQECKQLKIEKMSFYDGDPAVRDVLCALCVSVCKSLDTQLRCTAESNVVEALIGADYIITDLEGFADLRPQKTAVAVRRRGVISHPHAGACAFGAALRHVPALLRICEQARRYAKPGAQLLNLTAPGGVLLQAAWQSGYDFVCGFPLMGMKVAAVITTLMKKEAQSLGYSLCGLAEACVLIDLRSDGKAILPALLEEEALYNGTPFSEFSKPMLMQLSCLPSPVWSALFYPEQRLSMQSGALELPEKALYDVRLQFLSALSSLDPEKQRHAVLDAVQNLLKKEQSLIPDVLPSAQTLSVFNPYNRETSVPAAAVLDLLRAQQSEDPRRVKLLQKNNGTVPMLAREDCVAVTAFVSRNGSRTVPGIAAREDVLERIRREAYYERMLASALIHNDLFGAAAELAMHPLVNSCSVAAALTGELHKINCM